MAIHWRSSVVCMARKGAQMKNLIKYLKEDFSDWRNDPLYHGGLWEDIIVAGVVITLLAGFILWQL